MKMEMEVKIESKIEVNKYKTYILKILTLTLGNIIAAMGISLCALAGKGVDPLTVLYQGICGLSGLEIGIVALGLNIIMLIACMIVDKSSIKSGTIISMFTFSVFLNFFINNIGNVLTSKTPVILWLYLIFGIILMGIGFSTCILAGVGPNCLDVVLGILIDKTKRSMKECKAFLDFVSAAMGIALGAKFGIGTVLCVMLVGVIYTWNMNVWGTTRS